MYHCLVAKNVNYKNVIMFKKKKKKIPESLHVHMT